MVYTRPIPTYIAPPSRPGALTSPPPEGWTQPSWLPSAAENAEAQAALDASLAGPTFSVFNPPGGGSGTGVPWSVGYGATDHGGASGTTPNWAAFDPALAAGVDAAISANSPAWNAMAAAALHNQAGGSGGAWALDPFERQRRDLIFQQQLEDLGLTNQQAWASTQLANQNNAQNTALNNQMLHQNAALANQQIGQNTALGIQGLHQVTGLLNQQGRENLALENERDWQNLALYNQQALGRLEQGLQFGAENLGLANENAARELNQTLLDIGYQYQPRLNLADARMADTEARAAHDAALFSTTMRDVLPAYRTAGMLTRQHYDAAVAAVREDSAEARRSMSSQFATATGRVRAMVMAVSGDAPELSEDLISGIDQLSEFVEQGMAMSEDGQVALAAAARDLAGAAAEYGAARAIGELGRDAEKTRISYEKALSDMLMERAALVESRNLALQSAREWASVEQANREAAWALEAGQMREEYELGVDERTSATELEVEQQTAAERLAAQQRRDATRVEAEQRRAEARLQRQQNRAEANLQARQNREGNRLARQQNIAGTRLENRQRRQSVAQQQRQQEEQWALQDAQAASRAGGGGGRGGSVNWPNDMPLTGDEYAMAAVSNMLELRGIPMEWRDDWADVIDDAAQVGQSGAQVMATLEQAAAQGDTWASAMLSAVGSNEALVGSLFTTRGQAWGEFESQVRNPTSQFGQLLSGYTRGMGNYMSSGEAFNFGANDYQAPNLGGMENILAGLGNWQYTPPGSFSSAGKAGTTFRTGK